MDKILVTGANGQLGNEIKEIAGLFPQFQFVYTDVDELNITNQDKIEEFIKNGNFSFLINCAAYTAVDKAEEDTDFANLLNKTAVGYLAKAAKKFDMAMIHVSTDYVFDGSKNTPYAESDPTCPNSSYGRSKEGGEKYFLLSGARGIIIRTSWLYSGFGNNFVKTMIRFGKERNELNVIFDQIGTPTYAADLAKAILDILVNAKNDPTILKPAIYHYSNEGVTSWYDFATEIIKSANLNCKIKAIETKDYPLPANRPFYSVLNKERIKNTFSIEIPHWRDSLLRCLKVLGINQ